MPAGKNVFSREHDLSPTTDFVFVRAFKAALKILITDLEMRDLPMAKKAQILGSSIPTDKKRLKLGA